MEDVTANLVISACKLAVNTIMIAYLFRTFGHKFQSFMKMVLGGFEILFICGVICNTTAFIFIKHYENDLEKQYLVVVILAQWERVSFCLFVIIMQKVLFVLKRVEL